VDLASLRGKVVLVNFWATWCLPCLQEMPSLEKFARTYDVEVLAVSVDDGWEPVDKFLGKNTSFRVALDLGAKVSQIYGTTQFPESYLVDRGGKARLKFIGPRNWADPSFAALLKPYGVKSLAELRD
jgi:thiol-disulfide isomerase/thioredoxin